MTMTQHDRLCLGLEALGAEKLPQRGKYTRYKRLVPTKSWPFAAARFYFVGKAGALRVSKRDAQTTSVPCNDTFRQQVLDAPDQALAQELADG